MSTHKHTPSHRIAWSTSKGYFISPSTRPGLSTNVTKLKRFCREVQISVPRYSDSPEIERKLHFRQKFMHICNVNLNAFSPAFNTLSKIQQQTFKVLQWFEVWIKMECCISLKPNNNCYTIKGEIHLYQWCHTKLP